MTKYKSYRIIDEKAKWVIIDEDGKIIDKEPSNEKLRSLEKDIYLRKRYNDTNTCDRCGINFDIATGNPCREYDEKGNRTGKRLCHNCYEKFDPNSQKNIIKSLRNRRTRSLNPNSSQAKGDLFEELTCQWIGVKNLNKESDNYKSPIDHSHDSELGIIQTKGRFYDSINRYWTFSCLERDWDKEFDNMICYCASKNGKIIEKIYIFPISEIIGRTSIGIYKNSSRGEWYEKYRVTDEEEIKKVNNIWKKIKSM